jgi:hypothetical protein
VPQKKGDNMENGGNPDPSKTNNQGANAGGDGEKEKFVSRSAYEEVSKDMHKYKTKVKDTEAKVSEYEAKLKAIEEAKLLDEKRFEELYQKEKERAMRAEDALKTTNDHYMRSVKMTALMRELGGNIKAKYLIHADLNAIVVHDDGTLSSESVTAVANKFRQENPELVPAQNVGNINDVDATSQASNTTKPINLDNMKADDLRDLLAKAPKGRHIENIAKEKTN